MGECTQYIIFTNNGNTSERKELLQNEETVFTPDQAIAMAGARTQTLLLCINQQKPNTESTSDQQKQMFKNLLAVLSPTGGQLSLKGS